MVARGPEELGEAGGKQVERVLKVSGGFADVAGEDEPVLRMGWQGCQAL